MIASAARAVGIAVAIAALLDPSVSPRGRAPARVRVAMNNADPDAAAVRAELARAAGDRITLVDAGSAIAAVIIGSGVADPTGLTLDETIPLSRVILESDVDVRIAEAPASVSVQPGHGFRIPISLEGHGVAGKSSTVVLEDRGIEIGRVEHRWTRDGRASTALPFVAIPELRSLSVRALALPGERRLVNNRADVRVAVSSRPFSIAVVEPRPSWPAAFVRRALEADPRFDVSSIQHVSRGIVSRTGQPPRSLAPAALMPFDAVVIGAPEDLTQADVTALSEFADRRGGTVVLLPDRKPSGAYVNWMRTIARGSGSPVSEHLLQQPQVLAPSPLIASELLSVHADSSTADVLAATRDGIVIGSWPVGDGRLVFSGALDAWRYRADPKASFDLFWRALVADAAAAAPPALGVMVAPALVRPNGRARVTVRLRRTEISLSDSASRTDVPAVRAEIVAASGSSEMIRLWPGAELGSFEGDAEVGAEAVYTVRARGASGAAAETTVLVDGNAVLPELSPSAYDDIPRLSGGVSVDARNLQPLVEHLRSLPRPAETTPQHPMRSAWWMTVFVGALAVEWAIRRRRGLA